MTPWATLTDLALALFTIIGVAGGCLVTWVVWRDPAPASGQAGLMDHAFLAGVLFFAIGSALVIAVLYFGH